VDGIIAKRVIYSGVVQGVGFRATACHLAQRFDVSGTVRNLPDGTVESVVQGGEDEVNAFLAAVSRRMGSYIRHQAAEELPVTQRTGFHIIR
jgi:acylphosphatase